MPTRLVLVGAGHPHLAVLRTLIRDPLEDFEATIVTADPRQFHPAMLPLAVEGAVPFDAIAIDVAALARKAGVRLKVAVATGLDRTRREVRLGDGSVLRYDVLSIATGTGLAGADLPEVRTWALMTRPTAEAAALNAGLDGLARRKSGDEIRLAVVGGGRDAIELALAARARLVRAGRIVRTTLLVPDPTLLPQEPETIARAASSALAASGVELRTGAMPSGAAAGSLTLAGGERFAADGIIWATGPAPLPFARATGLSADAAGTLRVDAWLRSLEDPLVFAAGTAATVNGAMVDPLHCGRVLAHNLLCVCTATGPLRRYTERPRPRFLVTGARRAAMSWGPVALEAGWLHSLKGRLDRGYVARLAR